MTSENKGSYSANQQVIEANELLAIGCQDFEAVQEQLDLAMTRLNRYPDESERTNRKRTDRDSALRSLLAKLPRSKKVKEHRQRNST
jgi:hypothetical protein